MTAFPDLRRGHLAAAHVAVLLLYAVLLYVQFPYGQMATDSWSYLELARSLGDDPYRIVTLRSYWSTEYSAAFPIGYPAILHGLHLLSGFNAYSGIAFNIVVALLTPLAVSQLARAAGAGAAAGWIAGLALLCFRPYIGEVLGARSMPLALLATVLALTLVVGAENRRGFLLAGFLLGLACLLRFDRLPLLLLVLLALPFLRRQWLAPLPLLAGALLVMSPWIFFSQQHFGVWWATDNAWVATSAQDAFVNDFPAIARETLWTDPWAFVAKCAGNAGKILQGMGYSLGWMPLLLLAAAARWHHRDRWHSPRATLLFLPLLALAALFPLLMTAYAAQRYFSMFFLFALLFLLAGAPLWTRRWREAAVVLTIVPALVYAVEIARAEDYRATGALQTRILAALHDCQLAEPAVRYVFPRSAGTEAARYGAEFAGRSAFTPRNLSRSGDRTPFEQAIGPLRYVVQPMDREPGSCAAMLSPVAPAQGAAG